MRCLLIPALFFAVSCVFAEPVKIGKFQAKIVPEQVAPLTFPGKGLVTDLVDPSQRLEAGTVVAILNKENTATEREDMELALEREILKKKDDMRELEAQRRKVKFYLSLTPEERRYSQQDKKDDLPLTTETLKDLDTRMDLLRRETSTMQRRKRHEFDTKHKDLTLRMPFTGRLQYNITLPEDLSKPFEYSGGTYQGFATACDDSAFYITVAVASSDISQLPEESFSVDVPLPGKKKLRGTFDHRKVERSANGGDMLVYFFRVPDDDAETAFSMLGTNASATLYYDPGTDVECVSKVSLVADPRASECEDWEQLVETVYPGYGIVIIAERSIIIRKK